jgi:hypothetical protein
MMPSQMTSPRTSNGFRHCIFIGVLAAILAGCATRPAPVTVLPHRSAPASSAGSAWWYARFRLSWPEGADPAWHADALIAHQVVKPVLDRHLQDIPLWRFHRRAARDAAGHQFSFIFFASPETARRVYSEISDNPTLQQAESSGRIMAVICDDTAILTRNAIEDTSDPTWPPPLRLAWPYYVMGASQTWLDLISAMAGSEQTQEVSSTFAELEQRYAGINASITALWQNEGRHAFLHHLNALFGYEPIIIIEECHMRF